MWRYTAAVTQTDGHNFRSNSDKEINFHQEQRRERERQQIFGNTEIIIFRAIVSLSYGYCSFCSPEIYGLDMKYSKQKTNSLTLYGVVTIITQNSCLVEKWRE